MKKIFSVVLMLLTFVSCGIFSACNDKVRMSFISESGEALNSISLVIDDYDNINYESMRVAVQFDGISASAIGDIDIKSEPKELVSIVDKELVGNRCFFTVTANRSNIGKLIVTHMSTGSTASLPISIGRKSSDIELISDTYVIGIQPVEHQAVIDSASVVKLVSSSPNAICTDKVYYTLASTSLPGGITAIEEMVGEETFITGFNVSSTVTNGTELLLNPVTVMQGYDNTEYSNKPVKIKFVKELEDENVVLSTDEYHKDYIDDETVLITNDYTTNTTTTNETYAYNNFQFDIKYLLDDESLSLGEINGINYFDYYDIEFDYDEELIFDPSVDGSHVTIQAKDYTAAITTIDIILTPRIAGNLPTILKSVRIKGELKPTDFVVEMQGKVIDINEKIDLFNFYAHSSNALGELFNFSTVPEYAYKDMQNMRIKISPALLNAYTRLGNKPEGTNVIYTDESFSEYFEGNGQEDLYSFRNNKYVLEFYVATTPMRFYFDQNEKLLVSEIISSDDNIYIKYVETNILTDKPLAFDLTSVYSGDLRYLKDIKGTSKTLNFNHNEGISEIIPVAGYLTNALEGGYKAELYDQEIEKIYLNRREGNDSTETNAYLLYLENDKVLGENKTPISNAELTVSVNGGGDNPLKLKQYSSNDGNGKNVTGSTILDPYIYAANAQLDNIILLVFDKNTDIGEYTITFTSKNGYKIVIPCVVYQDITNKDVSYEIGLNDSIFENTEFRDSYDCDYIAESGTKTDLILNVLAESRYYVIKYSFSATIDNADIERYLDIDSFKNTSTLSFLKGTYISGENRYITFTMKITVPTYDNIVSINGSRDIDIIKTFFIYDKIDNKKDISINHTSLNRLMNGENYLGAYDKDKSIARLEISLTNNDLWNYVQSYVQEDIFNIPTESNNKYKVVWYTEKAYSSYITRLDQMQQSIELQFSGNGSSYYKDIYAEIKQFNNTISLRCRVVVDAPIITEELTIKSPTEIVDGYNTPIINLKAGETYQMDVKNLSNHGKVTNPGIYMVVVDNYGNVDTSSVIVDNATGKLTVRDRDSLTSGLRVIVFAKDALKENIDSIYSGYNNPATFLMSGEGIFNYSNAFTEISLMLSDGSETNPYAIFDADDFWDINNSPSMKDKHYRLMTNIDIRNTTSTQNITSIDGFSGVIESNYILKDGLKIYLDYTIYGVHLNEINQNLFKNFSGRIHNIRFVVNYGYQINTRGNYNLGLVDTSTSDSVLENVNIIMEGNSSFNNVEAKINFGALVGTNEGEIRYTLDKIIGVQGSISITGDSAVHFGGLVGLNTGILNYNVSETLNDTDTNTDIEFIAYVADEGAIASVNINSQLTNVDSSVGGVVGLNLCGYINNVYAVGNIVSTHGNIGGIIGINDNTQSERDQRVTIELDNKSALESVVRLGDDNQITNVISNVTIVSTGSNVGGITGKDIYGRYYECHYQILSESDTAIKATTNVGGIAGYSKYGWFEYCSVMSYRWNYADLDYTFGDQNADIMGNNMVAGIVGGTLNEIAENGVKNGDIVNNVVVIKSSVNAYLKANENASGVLNNLENTRALMLYTYYMGKLDGTVNINSLLDNDDLSVVNIAYALASGYELIEINVTAHPEMFTNSIEEIWAYNASINNGYLYISKKDTLNTPLFDVVPTSVVVNVNNPQFEGKKIIHLDYYESDMITDSNVSNAVKRANTHSFSDYFNFAVEPNSLGKVRLAVESNRPSILAVVGNEFIIKGVGQVTLTFKSVLNGSIRDEVIIDISLPIGDNFVLSENGIEENESIANKILGIAPNKSKQYYALSTGEKIVDSTLFKYNTNENVNLHIEIAVKSGDLEEGKTIADYISTSGILDSKNENNSKLIYDLPYDIPFSINVLRACPNVIFTFTVTPYINVNYYEEIEKLSYEDKVVEFFLQTYEGAKEISLNYDSLVLYPNDTSLVTAYVETDTLLDGNELIGGIFDSENGDLIINNSIISLVSQSDEIKNGVQEFTYRVSYAELNLNGKAEIDIEFKLSDSKKTNLRFTLLPQRINKIDLKNYVYKNYSDVTDKTIEQADVLKSENEGLIILDVAPINGYFDYLEITDATGSEEITFSQIDGVRGDRINKMDESSADGKGIKLYKQEGSNSLYVSTRIDSRYSSKIHNVKVSAYITGGIKISEDFYSMIDVRMLPSISIQYQDPKGKVSEQTRNVYLANGVDAKLKVTTANSDGNVEPEFKLTKANRELPFGEYFEFNDTGDGFFDLISKRYDPNLLDATLTIKVSTTATRTNGDFDIAENEISFKIVNFVIHDVTVTHSTNNGKTIYGNYGVPIELQFTFKGTDISFYNNGSVWANEYVYDPTITESNGTLYYINELLALINGGDYISVTELEFIELKNENGHLILTVSEPKDSEINAKLLLNLPICLENGNWRLDKDEDAGTTGNTNKIKFEKEYELAFSKVYADDEADLIKDAEDFLNMTSNDEAYYILGDDIELDDYAPLDVRFKVFDGNGHKIIINSFAEFIDVDIRAGLFKQIDSDMLVTNLTVEYNIGRILPSGSSFSSTYIDLCHSLGGDVDYTSAEFGGITAVNNGLISNCHVKGTLAVRASRVENKVSNYEIAFNIGGLVAENTETGYITNSTSELKISALANIGGFVFSNEGKIVSCSFNADTGKFNVDGKTEDTTKGLIYAYNRSVVSSSVIKVGGFVVENSNEISMSYVKSGITLNNSIGNISVKDISAGFVYSNTGDITNSYADIDKVGENSNNTFSGFVNANSGRIKNVYTIVNRGDKSSSVVNMFAPATTTGIENSYEIKLTVSGYNNSVEGLNTLDYSYRFIKDSYVGFDFGNNISSVWTIRQGELPKLVSTEEKVEFTGDKNHSDEYVISQGKTLYDVYYGLRDVERVDNKITDSEGNITGYNYTWRIVDNKYGTKTNPILLYDINTWDRYLSNDTTKYYRLIKDIDFGELYSNPNTSTRTFSGNIQGNNMNISGLMIYTSAGLDAIGLFKQIKGNNDNSVVNAIRNINLNANSVQATRTKAVGILAGIVQDFNLYNITVSSEQIIVGGNAVGGLAGIIRGNFDIENIISSVGVNSTRSSGQFKYSIYTSRNNGVAVSNNLAEVYYAGSVAGILDGYDESNYNINNDRNLENSKYFVANKISVNGDVTLIGDSVGTLFGLVGERVKLMNSSVNLTGGMLAGVQYTAALVGENRGWIVDCIATSQIEDLFNRANSVTAGLVGLNLGGLIDNCESHVDIVLPYSNSIVAGLVGRNVLGYISSSYVDAKLQGKIVGGIIGGHYDSESLINYSSGLGAISNNSHIAVPSNDDLYGLKDTVTNVSISENSIRFMLDNITFYYTYSAGQGDDYSVNAKKVLGLLVGLTTDNATDDDGIFETTVAWSKKKVNDNEINILIFNQNPIVEDEQLESKIIEKATIAKKSDKEYICFDVEGYVIEGMDYEFTIITYVVGSEVSIIDGWSSGQYSEFRLVFKNASDAYLDQTTNSAE